jgi:hypothetical protein
MHGHLPAAVIPGYPAAKIITLNCNFPPAFPIYIEDICKNKNMSHPDKNVILALAFNYSRQQLLPFFNSLNVSGFTGDLVLFVNGKSEIPANETYGFRVVTQDLEILYPRWIRFQRKLTRKTKKWDIWEKWDGFNKWLVKRRVRKNKPLTPWNLTYFFVNFYIATARYPFYYDYLSRNRCTGVFLTDISDVVFQGNVFAGMEAGKLIAFQEDPGVKLGEQYHNSLWIREGFGDEILSKMADEIIYCSGTILGDRPVCLKFLGDFITELLSGDYPVDIVGFDQGVYNYMISYLKRNYFEKEKNGRRVYTMGTVPAAAFEIDEKEALVSTGRQRPPVLHQYNRHPHLAKLLLNKYAPAATEA